MIGFNLGPVATACRQGAAGGGGAAPSPWAFVSSGAVTTVTTGTSLVLPLGATAQAGDFIVTLCSTATSLTTPPGTAVDAGTPLVRYLTATGGETSVSFTLGVSDNTASGIAVLFRPTSAGIRTASSSLGGTPPAAVNIAVSNLPSLIIVAGNHNGAITNAWAATLPADFVQVANVPGNAAGTVRALYLAYKVQTSGTTTGDITLRTDIVNNRVTVGAFRLT